MEFDNASDSTKPTDARSRPAGLQPEPPLTWTYRTPPDTFHTFRSLYTPAVGGSIPSAPARLAGLLNACRRLNRLWREPPVCQESP
jgi:hypothetical protein